MPHMVIEHPQRSLSLPHLGDVLGEWQPPCPLLAGGKADNTNVPLRSRQTRRPRLGDLVWRTANDGNTLLTPFLTPIWSCPLAGNSNLPILFFFLCGIWIEKRIDYLPSYIYFFLRYMSLLSLSQMTNQNKWCIKGKIFYMTSHES